MHPERVVRALEACGLHVERQRGSQVILSKPGLARPVVVVRHGRELGPRVLAKILSQAEVSAGDFLKHV